jgi:hypothetical protein
MKKERLFLVALGFLYTFILQKVYIELITPLYAYTGLTYLDPGGFLSNILLVLSIIPLLWMPIAITKSSQTIYWTLYIFVYVPASFMPCYTISFATGLFTTLMLLGSFLVIEVFYRINLKFKIDRRPISSSKFNHLLILLSSVGYSLLVSTLGFKLKIPSLDEVYDVRADLVSSTQGQNWINYLSPWLANVTNSYALSVGLLHSNNLLLFIGPLLQLFIYSLSGHKGVVFSFALVLVLYFSHSNRGKNFGTIYLLSITSVVFLSYLIDTVIGSYTITSLVVRRTILTPGVLTGWYFDFFSTNPIVLYSHSFMSFLLKYPYNQNYAFVIMESYSGQTGNANANLWADGFANLGYIGPFISSFILSILMKVIDALSSRDYSDLLLMSMMLGLPAMNLVNTSVLTTMWTHGLLLILILFYFMPLSSDYKKKAMVILPQTGEV